MRRIYVIVPKKLRTKPAMKVTAGYAIAQAHHATVVATKSYDLGSNTTVIVLQIKDSNALKKLAARLFHEKVLFRMYYDSVSDRNDQTCATAIVTTTVEKKLECLKRLRLYK